jgi:hypothetical protein
MDSRVCIPVLVPGCAFHRSETWLELCRSIIVYIANQPTSSIHLVTSRGLQLLTFESPNHNPTKGRIMHESYARSVSTAN